MILPLSRIDAQHALTLRSPRHREQRHEQDDAEALHPSGDLVRKQAARQGGHDWFMHVLDEEKTARSWTGKSDRVAASSVLERTATATPPPRG